MKILPHTLQGTQGLVTVLVQADALTGDSLSPRMWVVKGMDLGASWKKITKSIKLWKQSQVGQGVGNRAYQVWQ